MKLEIWKTMRVQGDFETSTRAYFADLNFFGFWYAALRVTWEPTLKPGTIRVTADFYGYNCITLFVIEFDDADEELEFHRRDKRALESKRR
jgi:hypothetical protein